MDKNVIWSLRLGFSGRQSDTIKNSGLKKFLSDSFSAPYNKTVPEFLSDEPKTLAEFRQLRQLAKSEDADAKKKAARQQIKNAMKLRVWWLENMTATEFPLREKMTCFWHNHFVSSSQKVKLNHWVFEHNTILRTHAFGNLKTLVKEILRSNAMVRYLDNNDNRKGKINENLSRELLELFTIGIGNYTEDDIKNGAKALAGLSPGLDGAKYRPMLEDRDTITYLGKTGIFKADDLVDIIFEQRDAPYHITRKILKWFIYDDPDPALVAKYGDLLRSYDYELQPFLRDLFTQEFTKDTAGSKIKDPLVYVLQLLDELNAPKIPHQAVAFFLRQQGMDLFNQPNVKGWDGGRSWLTSQIYLQRHQVADLLCSGKNLNRQPLKTIEGETQVNEERTLNISIDFPKNGSNLEVIDSLANRLLFKVGDTQQSDFEKRLKYDFDPTSPGAANAVLRLFNDMVKAPEFQLI